MRLRASGRRGMPAFREPITFLLWACFCTPLAAQDDPGDFKFVEGPAVGKLSSIAEIQIPEGFQFLGARDARELLELMQNPTSGDELGLVMPAGEEDHWFVVFEFSDIGYVKDDEKDDLDADAMFASIREGTKQGNKERRKRGWPTLDVTGWIQKPHYDAQSHNLEWAIRGESEGEQVVNYNTRILGRHGVMEAALVADPDDLENVLPAFKSLLAGFGFTSGNKYAEFQSGDKIAEYGLAALITGGAAAVALKTGLLQKFWKLIVLGVVGAAVAVKRFFRRIAFGSSE